MTREYEEKITLSQIVLVGTCFTLFLTLLGFGAYTICSSF